MTQWGDNPNQGSEEPDPWAAPEQPSTESPGPNAAVPAHPGKRLIARVLDTLILAAFFGVLYAIGLGDGAFHTITRSDGTQELLIDQGKLAQLTIATGLLGFVYEWLFIA